MSRPGRALSRDSPVEAAFVPGMRSHRISVTNCTRGDPLPPWAGGVDSGRLAGSRPYVLLLRQLPPVGAPVGARRKDLLHVLVPGPWFLDVTGR